MEIFYFVLVLRINSRLLLKYLDLRVFKYLYCNQDKNTDAFLLLYSSYTYSTARGEKPVRTYLKPTP